MIYDQDNNNNKKDYSKHMEIRIEVLIIKFHSVSVYSISSTWYDDKKECLLEKKMLIRLYVSHSESIRPRNVDRCSSNVNTERSDLVSIRIVLLKHGFVLMLLLLLCSSPIFHINFIQLNTRVCVCVCVPVFVLQIYRAIQWIKWKSWREQFLLEYS